LVPHFDTCTNWREVRIVPRQSHHDGSQTINTHMPPTCSGVPKPHPWDPSVLVKGVVNDKETQNHEENQENEFIGSQGESATRNSVVIRFKGQVDVLLTPLLLEGLQRYVNEYYFVSIKFTNSFKKILRHL